MPIKNLTNRQPQFPEIGQLRKGAPKEPKRPGKDLTYFRFTSDIQEVLDAFEAAYDGEPRLINCLLPFQYADDVWQAWQEHWVAGGLKHRCDGEHVVRIQNDDGTYTDPEPGTMPCPGNCKPSGRLTVVIPELGRLAYVTALTTSKHDIVNLDRQLRALETVSRDLRGIPLQLRRRKKRISTPGPNGKRVRRDKWLLSIEAAPSWVELQLAAQQAAAIPILPRPVHPHRALPNGAIIVNGQTGEVLNPGTAEDNGPNWDDVPDQGEGEGDDLKEGTIDAEGEDFEPPPDCLLVEIPAGKYKGKTLGHMLNERLSYVEWIVTNAQDEAMRESAQAALEWHKEQQPELW